MPAAAAEGGAEGGDCIGALRGGTVHEAAADAAVTTDSWPDLEDGGEAEGEGDGAEFAFCIAGNGAGPTPLAADVGASFGEGARDDAAEAVVDLAPFDAEGAAEVEDAAGFAAAAAVVGTPTAGVDAELGVAAAVEVTGFAVTGFAPGVEAALSVFTGTVGVDGADVNVDALSTGVMPAVGEARGEGEAAEELREAAAPPCATANETGTEG